MHEKILGAHGAAEGVNDTPVAAVRQVCDCGREFIAADGTRIYGSSVLYCPTCDGINSARMRVLSSDEYRDDCYRRWNKR